MRAILRKAVVKMRNVKLAHAWESWLELLELRQDGRAKMARAVGHWRAAELAKGWGGWRGYMAERLEKKRIVARWGAGAAAAGQVLVVDQQTCAVVMGACDC